MSRSGYSDDYDGDGSLAMWRGQVSSAIPGKRGQAFLRELIEALDAMPEKSLIANDLRKDGEVCALGSVGAKRGLDLEALDPHDYDSLAGVFNIAHQLVREIEWVNDEMWHVDRTPEGRWHSVRNWAAEQLKPTKDTRTRARC